MASSRKSKDDDGVKLRCWGDLPSDMLQLIFNKLLNDKSVNNTLQFQNLGSVCRSWRSSIIPLQSRTSVHHFPLKLPPPPPSMCVTSSAEDLEVPDIPATLKQSDILLFTPFSRVLSNNAWIVKVRQRRPEQNTLCLENPFSVSPAAFEYPDWFKRSFSIFDNPVKQITRSYVLEYVTVDRTRGRKLRFAKVVMLWSNETDDEFSALALFEEGKLGLWRSGEAGWRSFVGDHQKACLTDIIAFKGKVYATTKEGRLMIIDTVTCEVYKLMTDKLVSQGLLPSSTHLVESNGHLYLVLKGVAINDILADAFRLYEVRSPQLRVLEYVKERPDTVRVYLLGDIIDLNCSLKLVDNLEDCVFFASKYMSFSLTEEDLGWFEGNCVLMPRNINEVSTVRFSELAVAAIVLCQRHYANCLSVFTLEDLTMGSGSTLSGLFTSIFWPPPKWLCKSARYWVN